MVPLPSLSSSPSFDYTLLRQYVGSDPSRFILGPLFTDGPIPEPSSANLLAVISTSPCLSRTRPDHLRTPPAAGEAVPPSPPPSSPPSTFHICPRTIQGNPHPRAPPLVVAQTSDDSPRRSSPLPSPSSSSPPRPALSPRTAAA
uniref:Uncharacterized protein n=1 Tax=Ananas comosus var. bracteatus TaxID=296719 RepID=A0A6V7NX16_ANACO|nr:unnamed protein product [Ananas comosus var. bracteatus]